MEQLGKGRENLEDAPNSPKNLDLYINLSQIYIQAKRFGDAEKVLRRADELDPKNSSSS